MNDDTNTTTTSSKRVHIKLVAPLPLPFDTSNGIWVDAETTTVAEIKQLIAARYPSNPPSNDTQRIIYRGRLLQDDEVLAAAFGNVLPDQTVILHIVVPPYSVEQDQGVRASSEVPPQGQSLNGTNTSDAGVAAAATMPPATNNDSMTYLQLDSLDSMLTSLEPFNRLPKNLSGLNPSNAILAKTSKDQPALIVNRDGIQQLTSLLNQHIPLRDMTSIYDTREIRDASPFTSRDGLHLPDTATANNNNPQQQYIRFRLFINGREHHSPIMNRMGNAYNLLGQYINMVFLTFHLAFILMFITDDYRIWFIATFGIILVAYLKSHLANIGLLIRSWLPEMGFLNGAPGDINPTRFNHNHHHHNDNRNRHFRDRFNSLRIATKRIFMMFLASFIPEIYERWTRDYNERVSRLEQEERERQQQQQQEENDGIITDTTPPVQDELATPSGMLLPGTATSE